jgi:hypothetical protein
MRLVQREKIEVGPTAAEESASLDLEAGAGADAASTSISCLPIALTGSFRGYDLASSVGLRPATSFVSVIRECLFDRMMRSGLTIPDRTKPVLVRSM